MIVAGTGHRPQKLSSPFDAAMWHKLWHLAMAELEAMQPTRVITGMALGWDQAIARACIRLEIPFTAAVPCDDQELRWPPNAKRRYRALLAKADRVHVVGPGPYRAYKMHDRNKWMVDHAGRVLALWSGSAGGTAHTVRYARRTGVPVQNCWKRWEAASKPR